MKNRIARWRLSGLPVFVAVCLGGGLLAAPGATAAPRAVAAVMADEPGPAAQALTAPADEAGHADREALKAADRPPLSASKDALRRDYDDPGAAEPSHPAPSMKAPGAAAECRVEDFTGRTGGALVQQVKASTTRCVNTLFGLKGDNARLAFREPQMVSIADALRDGSATYPGDSSTGMPQLVLFLRAGYYVQYYNPDVVGSYGPTLRTAIRGGLDAFFASPRSSDVTDANGETLAEAVTLIDSAEQNARYLYVVKRLLAGYDSSYNSSWYMLNAVNSVYTVTFRGHQLPEFVRAVEADPSLIDSLHAFASGHLDLLGTAQSYLTSNAGRELGRFLQEASLRAKARPLAVALLKQSSMTGRTAPLWVGVAEMADYFDRANCADYGVCDLGERLKAAVLTVSYACSPSIRILAQQMSDAELASSCSSLRGQDAYFHGIARDSGAVAGDKNATIEVVAFDSSADYQTYAGAIYGIDTNNGGMYLEGDPAAVGNQARFIAYEAEWVRPAFQIWNLNHEYTHYLDGRFNMAGDFGAGVSTPTVWWIEGFAEYVSYSYREVVYEDAIARAGAHTHGLRTLFDTTYENADQARIYNWGYLAVRYMLQSHRGDVDTVLGHYRSGNWNAARAHLTSTIGSRYDAGFNTWLTACAAGECGTTLPECGGSDTRLLDKDCRRSALRATTGNYAYLYLYVPAGTARLRITTAGGTGDADLYYSASGWASVSSHSSRDTGAGSDHALTVDNPRAGVHYVSLYAAEGFDGAVVSTQY
ncbi:MAG TPA: M9 family metallopeptidase [Streptomyces sp.]|nr:M9 family metallopeptidase [Streptomyces sp.]